MTKVAFRTNIPFFNRDDFLTPFDKMFDQMVSTHYPDIAKSVGVNPMQGSAYPKVNVYEYDDKVGIVAEIPGLNKKQLNVSVEEGVLTISGDKHSAFENDGAKVLRRELKQSSFKRQFELGDLLDGENISADFKDGILSVSVPKLEPKQPKIHTVKIGQSLQIIKVKDDMYVVCGRVSAKKVTNESTDELKSWYSLADTVLRNGDIFYVCMKVIDVEFEEIQ